MAIQSASAKLYTGIRCWVVDKNISAALTASFSLGNQNQPSPVLVGGVPTVYPGVLVFRVKRYIADLVSVRSLTLVDTRLKTFGGGNNVITPGPIIDNTNNWKMRATVVCKFPTYFRIDVDKLQLPQGTTCTVSFEEDWVRDGVYLESTQASSAAIGNFFTFRTPWLGASFINAAFTLPTRTVLKIRQLSSSVNVSSSITARGVFNPGKFAALIAGNLVILTNAAKRVVTGANFIMTAQPTNVLITRIKQLFGSINSSSSLSTEFDIVIVAESQMSALTTVVPDAIMFKGSLTTNLQNTLQTVIQPNANFTVRSLTNNIISTVFSRSLRIKQLSASRNMLFSLSADVTNIQRVPRWRSGTSYSIIGGSTHIISNDEYVRLNGTQMSLYRFGSFYDSDAIAVSLSDPTKQFDAGPGGFYVAAGSVVDYGTFGSPQNSPISVASPVAAVCKLTSSKFAIYNPTTSRIEIYNNGGTKQTIYDTLAVNISTPRSISIRSGTGNNLDIISCSSGGFRHMKYNGTSYVTTTISTSPATDFRNMTFSADGLTLFIEGFNATAAYFMTRASVTSSFTTIQTITDATIAAGYSGFGYDYGSKEFVFIGNRSYQWNGSNYVYIRDITTTAGGLAFGGSSAATHIVGNTATNATFS